MDNPEKLGKNEVCVDKDGVPLLTRFLIQEPITNRPVAIIEAYTMEHARERFAKLAPYMRESFRNVLGEYFSARPMAEDCDETLTPLFHNNFFDSVEAASAVKH